VSVPFKSWDYLIKDYPPVLLTGVLNEKRSKFLYSDEAGTPHHENHMGTGGNEREGCL
jgi:hypothetical protein